MEDFWIWFTILMGGGSVVLAIGATIVAGLCTIIPFAAIGWYIYSQYKKRNAVVQAAQAWRTTTGQVLKSRVEVSGGDNASVHPFVLYAYDVNGRTYQSSQIRPGDSFIRITQNAYATIDRYPEGAIVQVHYNPDNPQESALERQ